MEFQLFSLIPNELLYNILSQKTLKYKYLRQLSFVCNNFNLIINKIVKERLEITNGYPRACDHCHSFWIPKNNIFTRGEIPTFFEKDNENGRTKLLNYIKISFSMAAKKYVKGDLFTYSIARNLLIFDGNKLQVLTPNDSISIPEEFTINNTTYIPNDYWESKQDITIHSGLCNYQFSFDTKRVASQIIENAHLSEKYFCYSSYFICEGEKYTIIFPFKTQVQQPSCEGMVVDPFIDCKTFNFEEFDFNMPVKFLLRTTTKENFQKFENKDENLLIDERI